MFDENKHPRDKYGRFTFRENCALSLLLKKLSPDKELTNQEKQILSDDMAWIRKKLVELRKNNYENEKDKKLEEAKQIYSSLDQYQAPTFLLPSRIATQLTKQEKAIWYERCRYISYKRTYLERYGNTYYVDIDLKIVVTRFLDNEFEAKTLIEFYDHFEMGDFFQRMRGCNNERK